METAALAAPAQTSSPTAFSGLAANFDTFLILLTTQLRHQDPLDPLNTEQFTSQLVQFAGVEQSIQTNAHFERLIALQAASERDGALSLVGRDARLEYDHAVLTADGASWRYDLPADASALTLKVVDGNGAAIAQRTGAALAGAHDFYWDGAKSDGSKAPPGVYRLIVEAADAEGAPLDVRIETAHRIDAVAFGSEGAMLETTAGLVALDAVRRVAAAN